MRFIKINQLTTNKDIIKYTYFVLVYVDNDKLINFHHMPVSLNATTTLEFLVSKYYIVFESQNRPE